MHGNFLILHSFLDCIILDLLKYHFIYLNPQILWRGVNAAIQIHHPGERMVLSQVTVLL
jgi:hypothetical protein